MRARPLGKRLLWIIGMFAALTWFGLGRAARIAPDEEVAFHGPYLFWSDHGLRLVLAGRVFEPERDSRTRRLAIDRILAPSLLRYMGKSSADVDAASGERMYRRLHPFLDDGESRIALSVRMRGDGDPATVRLGATGAGGYFAADVAAGSDRRSLEQIIGDAGELHLEVMLPPGDARRFGVSLPVPPRQLSLLVISDLDDTIRIAEVNDRPRMIERVFLHEYEAVPGMSALYSELASRGAWIHLVSGSPWQIAPVIEEFVARSSFPPSVLHLRQMGWDFWNSDSLETARFKFAEISRLMQQFPSCPVLLIGDSGEHDPEVYAKIVRRFPDRVAGVWIRRVGPPWDAARLAEAATQLGTDRVTAFAEPDELAAALPRVMTPR